jgi:hypothetical protein
MEPRELHEVLLLAAAAMGPDIPDAPVRVEAERPNALPAAKTKRKKANFTGNKYPYGYNLDVPAKEIRQWAWNSGRHCSATGIIPREIVEAFVEEHSG